MPCLQFWPQEVCISHGYKQNQAFIFVAYFIPHFSHGPQLNRVCLSVCRSIDLSIGPSVCVPLVHWYTVAMLEKISRRASYFIYSSFINASFVFSWTFSILTKRLVTATSIYPLISTEWRILHINLKKNQFPSQNLSFRLKCPCVTSYLPIIMMKSSWCTAINNVYLF